MSVASPRVSNPGRLIGLLYVVTSILGFFAMGYVPDKLIVSGNAAATASNIAASETLFRLGIASELLGQVGFIFVAFALYALLKGVNQRQAAPEAAPRRRRVCAPTFMAISWCHALELIQPTDENGKRRSRT